MTKEVENEPIRIFEIPLEKRFLTLKRGEQVTCIQVDNVGLFVYHDGSQELTPDFIRHHVIGRETTDCLIEARSPKEAIEIFYKQWEGAKIGGKHRTAKALWINTEVPIVGLPWPVCELLHKNREGRYICGQETLGGNGEFGMCILDKWDPPDECPLADFYDLYSDRRRADTLPIKTVEVDGVEYSYVMAEGLLNS